MSAADDFLSIDSDPISRDRWGRPLLFHGGTGEQLPYTRASTLGGYLSDHTGLHRWNLSILAKGLSNRPDLCAMIAASEPLDGTRKHDEPIKRKLAEHIDLALEVGGAHEKANWGTAIHSFCEPSCTQEVPESIAADVQAFRDLNLDIVMSEQFVANDELMAAGSFDHLVSLPGLGIVVLDIKTGMLKAQDNAVQLAVYAGGDLYNPVTNERTAMPEGINLDVGVIAHIPRGEGRCELHLVDLREGRKAAQVAAWTREWRSRKDLLSPYKVAAPEAFLPPWLVAS